jgi:hypothetical protein
MSTFDLSDTMDAIAAACVTAGIVKNAYGWPAESVTVPCVIVGYPTSTDYDASFGNAIMKVALPVFLVTGRPADKSSRDVLSTSVSAMKAALDGSLSGTVHSLRVTGVGFDRVLINDILYAAARFECEVYA